MPSLHFDPNSGAIVLSELVSGPYGELEVDMVLDTGATYTTFPAGFAELLGYRPSLSNERISLVTASGIEEAPSVTVDAIEATGVRINNVEVACLDLPPESQVEGLLGLSFLRATRCRIDFKNGVLELEGP